MFPIRVLATAVQTAGCIATSVEVSKRTHLDPASTGVAAPRTMVGHLHPILHFGMIGAQRGPVV